jgi:signal transduction histidine kinase/tetratricopeptide (TPR) repeat protein
MKKLHLVFLLFSFCNAYTQVTNKDSLLSLLSVAHEDTNKVYLLFTLADQDETSEPEKAKVYLRQAKGLSENLNFEKGVFKYYRHAAYINAYQSRYDSMLYYSKIVLDLATKKKDTFNIGVSLFNIGEAYKFMSDYENGLQYTLEGVRMLEGRGYTNIESNLYGGLQGTYLMLKQYEKAIEFGVKAVEIGRKLSDKNPLVSALVNLANCYGEVKNFSKAKALYDEAIEIAHKINSKSIEAMCYEGLADIALKEDQVHRIKPYAEKALVLHSETQNSFGIMASKQALAIYYLYTRDFPLATKFATEALTIADAENFLEARAAVLSTLSEISFATHNFKAAFRYADESKKTNEKIFTESVAQKDASMRVKYETEKKDTQLKLQQITIRQKNILNYILIGSAVALLLISLLSYRNYKAKQKLQQQRIGDLEKEKQLNATEAVLKGEEQERTRLAKDLHDGLGGMLSGIKYGLQTMKGNLIMTPENTQAFERSMDMLDTSIKEMRRVAHNMMPEALVKFGLNTALRDYCNDINQSRILQINYQSFGLDDEPINQTLAIGIYRIIQELVNNTLKHAAARTAIVQLSKTDQQLVIAVEDDGKGFDVNMLNQSKGMGWTNIQHRVEFLKGKLDIVSQGGKGTSVHIEFDI